MEAAESSESEVGQQVQDGQICVAVLPIARNSYPASWRSAATLKLKPIPQINDPLGWQARKIAALRSAGWLVA